MNLFYALWCAFIFANAAHCESNRTDTLEECKKIECPVYEVVEKKKAYEIRKYPAYKVALVLSTEVKGFLNARQCNYFKLYRYQRGNNANHHSFPMVYPFTSVLFVKKWTASKKVKEVVLEDKFKMAFYLPKALAKPPKPLDKSIEIVDIPERLVYAVSSQGHANPRKIIAIQEKLRDALTAAKVDFDWTKFGVMEYNRIDILWGRHFDVCYNNVKLY